MNNTLHQLKLGTAHIDSRHVRLIMVFISLILFVLGAGAPEAGDHFGG